MLYCTVDELKDSMPALELLQLVDDEKLQSFSTAATARITAAITDASAVVDAHFKQGGFPVPLEDTALARALTKKLAIAELLRRRNISNEARMKEYEVAVKFLQAAAEGKLSTGVGSRGEGDEVVQSSSDASGLIFTDENLAGF